MIEKVGIVGTGQMGSGIAEACARAGFLVFSVDSEASAVDRGKSRVENSLSRAVERGKVSSEDAVAATGRIKYSTDLSTLAECDIVIEAIVEDEEVKRELYEKLSSIVREDAILASNTSSIPIGRLAESVTPPGRVIGLHFFNPVPVMPIVEIIKANQTKAETVQVAELFVSENLGKTVVHGPDRAGFIVNALLVPYLLSAIRFYEQGLASKEDIDTGMELGCNMPMGPLRLVDFIGLDTIKFIADVLHHELGDPACHPPVLLSEMVAEGKLGKKTGTGFYSY